MDTGIRVPIDDVTIVTRDVDSFGVKRLMFYQNGELMAKVPDGFSLIMHLEDESEEQQVPFYGSFVLNLQCSYALRKNGLTRMRFIHTQTKEHKIKVL